MAQPMKAPFLAVTRGVAAVPFLEEFLGGHIANGEVTSGTVLAWGRKPSATKAEDFAARNRLPLLRIEDGFIRSIEPGADSPGYALALDDEGIYYDGGRASRLESLVGRALNSQETERARNLAALWRRERVSKYNHARERLEDLPADFVQERNE